MRPRLALLLVFAGASCQTPTEIAVSVTTDLTCAELNGVAITVGRLGELEAQPPTSTSSSCDGAGKLGTLVVVPSGASDEQVAIRVIGGAGVDPTQCAAPSYGPKCIVARRALHYLPHQAIALPIKLSRTCQGVLCPVDQTCVAGMCESALIDPGACASASGCGEAALDGGAPAADGGGPLATEGCGDVTGFQPGAPWPMKGRCGTRMARAPVNGPHKLVAKPVATLGAQASACPPELPSQCSIGGPVIAADGTIYVTDAVGLEAFRADGTKLWPYPIQGGSFAPPAIGHDGTVYVSGVDHYLYAVSPSGGLVWKFLADAAIHTSPAITPDGTVVFATMGQHSFGVTSKGMQRWTAVGGTDPALSLDGKTVYVGSGAGVHALDSATGVQTWLDPGSPGSVLPVASVGPTGLIFYSSGSELGEVNPGGVEVFFKTRGADDSPTPLPAGGALYADFGAHQLAAYDGAGNNPWNWQAGDFFSNAALLGADGTAYVFAEDSTVSIVSALGATIDSALVAVPRTNNVDPIGPLAMGVDGTLYVATADGHLLAFPP